MKNYFVNPDIFKYVKHWSSRQRQSAAGIVYRFAHNHKNWIGAEDAVNVAHIGVLKAYRRYGDTMLPQEINGYIRAELQTESKRKQRYVDSFNHVSSLTAYTKEPTANPEFSDLMMDIANILSPEEFDIVRRKVLLEEKLTKSEENVYRKALSKIKEVLYV